MEKFTRIDARSTAQHLATCKPFNLTATGGGMRIFARTKTGKPPIPTPFINVDKKGKNGPTR